MSRTLAPFALTAGLMKPIIAWIRNANDRRLLADMPDYLLKDIGLRRDQIADIGDAVIVRDEIEPARASFRRSAEVIDLAPEKASDKPERPEKPMAA